MILYHSGKQSQRTSAQQVEIGEVGLVMFEVAWTSNMRGHFLLSRETTHEPHHMWVVTDSYMRTEYLKHKQSPETGSHKNANSLTTRRFFVYAYHIINRASPKH